MSLEFAVSSFGWGYGLALNGQLAELKQWPDVECRLLEGLEVRLRREEDGEILPLDRKTIEEAFGWLCDQIRLPAVRAHRTDIRPSHLPLVSGVRRSGANVAQFFFLHDLTRSRALRGSRALPRALSQYIGIEQPATTIDLLEDKQALEDLLAPGCTPAARWPMPGGHPLVLLQQAAVNAAVGKLRAARGIVAINGPPGTGKTTLLRDLIAGVILERAHALVNFDDPASAFRHGLRARRG